MTWSPRPALAALALAASALGTGGCQPSRKSVELDWTFAGQTCAAAGVATIQVDIAGEILTPNRFACQDAQGHVTTGANLGSYLTGVYNITVQGFDTSGNEIFGSSQNFTVSTAHNVFSIDVAAVQATTGSVSLLWSFAGQTCAQANISVVHVTLDNQAVLGENNSADLPCHAGTGAGSDGTSISPLDPGNHRIDVKGYRNGQLAYDLENVTAAVVAGADTQLVENLPAITSTSASAQINWSFTGLSCAEAAVDLVRVAVDGAQVPGDFPCTAGGADAGVVTNLTAGAHSFTVQGIRNTSAGGFLVYSSTQATSATFATGFTTQVLVDAASASPGVGGAKLLWSGGVCSSATATANIAYTIHSPSNQPTTGTSTCGGAAPNAGIEFCSPGAAGCPAGSPGLTAGAWSIDVTATSGAGTSTASGVFFAVPNGTESTTTITLH